MKTPASLAGFPPVLVRVALALTAMMAASLVFSMSMTALLHWKFPYGTVWISKGNEWCDFFDFQARSYHFRDPSYWAEWDYPMTYPAPVAVLFGWIYKLPRPFVAYFGTLILGMAAWVAWLAHGLARRGLRLHQAIGFGLVILATCWPAYYLLDTANIEGLLVLILAAGVLATLRGRTWTGAALIGIAASMKYFPLALLALLFSRRRYREFGFGVLVAIAATLGSLAYLGPSVGVAQANINQALAYVNRVYITSRESLQLNFNHALFGPVKFATLLVYRVLVLHGRISERGPHEAQLIDSTLHIYLYATAILGLALYFWRIRKLPMLNQTICLTVCAVTLTPFSCDYTLNHLLIPFGLLCFYTLETWRQGRVVAGLDGCFACLCLILGFATFFTWKFAYTASIRSLALLTLLGLAMRFPFPWPELDGSAPA